MTETALPPEIAAPSLRWWATRSALATALPLLVFFGLRPDSFGLIPNSLDPFFYTGYAINFDDIMREIGDRYYFVSRWSSYYPAYLLTKVFGAVDGRLIWRLMLCVAILLSIWHLGRRWKWTLQTEMLVGLVVITMPMFARAFLTDYIEYTIVAYGIVLVIQCLEPRHSRVRSLFIGLLCGGIIVANPVAATICFAPVLGYFALSPKRGRGRIGEAATLAIGALGVVIFGLLLFRFRYGIPNVYRPSIEFARSHQHYHDPHKAPRLNWLGQFTWLYIPPVLLAATLVIRPIRERVADDRVLKVAWLVLAVQYVWQWYDQFVRDGDGLEVAYYWSYMYPAIVGGLVIFLGTRQMSAHSALLLSSLWVAALSVPRWSTLRLPEGWSVVMVFVAVSLVAVLLGRTRSFASIAVVLPFLLALQIVPPMYRKTGIHDLSPYYDKIFFDPETDGKPLLQEARWLNKSLDQIDDSYLMYAVNGVSSLTVAIFGAHVTGHLLSLDPSTSRFSQADVKRIMTDGTTRLAVYVPAVDMASALESLQPLTYQVLLDKTGPARYGNRLVVVAIRPTVTLAWPAAELPSQVGAIVATSRRASPGVDAAGYLTFGPMFHSE